VLGCTVRASSNATRADALNFVPGIDVALGLHGSAGLDCGLRGLGWVSDSAVWWLTAENRFSVPWIRSTGRRFTTPGRMADTSPEPNLGPPTTPADGAGAGVAPVAAPAVAAAACKIHFKAVGSAPILRKNKFKIDMHESFATVRVSDVSRGDQAHYVHAQTTRGGIG
jgi:hypothetical protein